MLEGLKILQERIKTNPEEFVSNDKWSRAFSRMKSDEFPWTEEEKETIKLICEQVKEIERDVRRNNFNAIVMQELMRETNPYEPQEAEDESPFGLVPMRKEGSRITVSKTDLEIIKELKRRENEQRS